jgi:hypothetical protein
MRYIYMPEYAPLYFKNFENKFYVLLILHSVTTVIEYSMRPPDTKPLDSLRLHDISIRNFELQIGLIKIKLWNWSNETHHLNICRKLTNHTTLYNFPSEPRFPGVVGIAVGWAAGVRFPTLARGFSLFHNIQTDSGIHPASYTMGTRGYLPGDKAARE